MANGTQSRIIHLRNIPHFVGRTFSCFARCAKNTCNRVCAAKNVNFERQMTWSSLLAIVYLVNRANGSRVHWICPSISIRNGQLWLPLCLIKGLLLTKYCTFNLPRIKTGYPAAHSATSFTIIRTIWILLSMCSRSVCAGHFLLCVRHIAPRQIHVGCMGCRTASGLFEPCTIFRKASRNFVSDSWQNITS